MPRTPDLAAQMHRVAVFAADGFAVWDNSWYGGHALPGYSLTFPALGRERLEAVLIFAAITASFVGANAAERMKVKAPLARGEQPARRAEAPPEPVSQSA